MDESKMTELNKAIEGMWDSLTDEQKAAAKACKSMDELAALAGAAGVELPDEMLDAVAVGKGKSNWNPETKYECPYCRRIHFLLKKKLTTITPAGESSSLTVDTYFCSFTNREFYHSSARKAFYDDNFQPISYPLASSGC